MPVLPTVAALAANDPGSTRLVYAMVGGLAIVGIALVVLGVWLIRTTRYDPPVLAPLERMGDGSWRKRDPATQQRILDELRPEGAEPLAAGKAVPELDAEFEDDHRPVRELDDLGPGVPADLPRPDLDELLASFGATEAPRAEPHAAKSDDAESSDSESGDSESGDSESDELESDTPDPDAGTNDAGEPAEAGAGVPEDADAAVADEESSGVSTSDTVER